MKGNLLAVSKTVSVAGMAAAMMAASVKQAEAVVMMAPGTTLPGQAYLDFGAQFVNPVVGIKRIGSTGNISYGSGVIIDERHVLTAAHVMDSTLGMRPAERIFVATGLNVLTPDIEVGIRRYSFHATYEQGGVVNTTGIDLAILELSTPLVGMGVDIATSPLPNNVTLDFAGRGQPGLASQDLQPFDGFLRAFQMISVDPSVYFANEIYNAGTIYGLLGTQYVGYASNGDSGGGVFYDGLRGIMTSASSGSTNYVDVTNQSIVSWINEFKMESIPETSTMTFTALGSLVLLIRRRMDESSRRLASPAPFIPCLDSELSES